ncbi:MAG: hypothetical protein LUH04_16945 [Clostridium sp.]|nr:hypothetical protein [Clostridium sp.]
MQRNKLKDLEEIIGKFRIYHKQTVPLCAAENVISDFVKLPLTADFQERYIMDNYTSYKMSENFIGSEYLVPFYSFIQKQCSEALNVKYTDARTLSGMNCLVTLLMALTKIGDKIMILPDRWGGHASVKPVCERLGLNVFDTPYIAENYDLDYKALNDIIHTENIKFILLAPSDIIKPLEVQHIDLSDSILLYDISQIMGMIYVGLINNPLNYSDNIVMFGGTHKTLPGPTSGLILTNNDLIYAEIERNINPKYLRNTQMHQVVSLLFALLELEYYGNTYLTEVRNSADRLGHILSEKGFDIACINGKCSSTHQVFIHCSHELMHLLHHNSNLNGITLNKKEKDLFRGAGIRLGVQEISRYGWNNEALQTIGSIFHELSKEQCSSESINRLKKELPEKKILYTFPQEIVDHFRFNTFD